MKNILKKLGVLGLTIAVLSPFIELKANAAEATNCTNHLQNYMFLDQNTWYLDSSSNKTFFEMYSKDNNGFQTLTHFPYAFLNQTGYTTTVTAIETNSFAYSSNSEALNQYWAYFDEAKSSAIPVDKINATDKKGAVFVKDNSFSSTFTDDTILLHGEWVKAYDANNQPITTTWNDVDGTTAVSIQSILTDADLAKLNVTIQAAQYNGSNYTTSTQTVDLAYIQSVVDNDTNVWPDGSGNKFIPLSITRKVNLTEAEIETMLNNYIFGYKDGSDIRIFTKSAKTSLSEIKSAKDSYTAYREFLENPTDTVKGTNSVTASFSESDIDFNTGKSYYWPVVFNVEYKSCQNTVSNWTLEYDDNVTDNSVANTPKEKTEVLGTGIKVDSLIPTRNGFVFDGWCEVANGSGKCYKTGEVVPSPSTSTTVTLFAQWKKTGSANNEKTGVVSYIIGFAAVGVVASGIYLISKKKNLFKQI